MTLDLDQIKYDPPGVKFNKNDVQIERSPEEIFMLSNLPSSTETQFSSISYLLEAKIFHSGGVRCNPQFPKI